MRIERCREENRGTGKRDDSMHAERSAGAQAIHERPFQPEFVLGTGFRWERTKEFPRESRGTSATICEESTGFVSIEEER